MLEATAVSGAARKVVSTVASETMYVYALNYATLAQIKSSKSPNMASEITDLFLYAPEYA